MSYPGDSSLSKEIRTRILDTLLQTLDLAEASKKVEALLGCDFMLQLDPLFEPARTLQERIQGSEGEVGVEDLRAEAEALAGDQELSSEDEAVANSEPAAHSVEDAPDEMAAEDDTEQETESGAEAAMGTDPRETAEFRAIAHLAPGISGIDAEDLLSTEGASPSMIASSEAEEPLTIDEVNEAAAEDDETEDDEADDYEGPDDEEPDDEEPTLATPRDSRLTSTEGQRVQSFLDEGQAALEDGNPQKAIDTWSRIFLIDGDNEEATARIEKAQLVKAEQERQLEELFAEAETFLEEDKPDEALVLLEKIIGLAPDHLAAAEMITELKDEEPSEEPASIEEPEPDSEESDEAGALQAVAVPPVPMLPTHGPPPVEAPPAPAPPVQRPFLSSNLRLILIGSGVLLLVALGAWMLSNNWSRLFPNSDSEPVVVRLPPDRMARLTALYDNGSVDQAIAALEKVQPNDPDYERAQLLLTEWQDSKAGDNEEEVDDAALDESRLATRQTILDQAREAYAAEEYLNAARLFARASALGPLEGAQADLFEDAKRQLEPIAQMIDLYTQREYKLALPSMWRYFEEHPENRDIRLLLVNSHYNLAVRSLRGGQPEAAEALLDEAIKLDLGDANAQRLFLFAKTYRVISRDLLYDIFVDNLEPRS